MTTMNRVLWVSLLCGGLSACGAGRRDESHSPESAKNTQPSPTSSYPLPRVGDTFAGGKVLKVENVRPDEAAKAETPNGPPAPRTGVTLQTKYMKAIQLESGEVAYETIQQWVFHPEGDKDGSLICVEDGNHCIGLLALKKLLNRQVNDPLGIR